MDLNHGISENFSPSLSSSYSNDNMKDGKSYVYKKTSYQYSSSGTNTPYRAEDKNVDQLDELLLDLKNEREHSKDFDLPLSSVTYRTNEYERSEPKGTVTNTMRAIKASSPSVLKQAAIESNNITTTDHHTVTSSGYSSRQGTLTRGNYEIVDSTGPGRNYHQNVFEAKHKNYQSGNRFERGHPNPSNDNFSSTSFSENLQDIALSDDILPLPGVKVTTTVRTYTYEIPADSAADRSGTRTLLYRNNNNNNTVQPIDGNRMLHSPPQSIFYNTESYSTVKNPDGGPFVTNLTKEMNDQVDITKRKDLHTSNSHLPEVDLNKSNKTFIYKLEKSQNLQTASESVCNPIKNPNYEMEQTSNKYYYQEPSKVVNYFNSSHGEQRGVLSPAQINSPMSYPAERTSQIPLTTSSVSSNHILDHKPTAYTQPAPFPVDGGRFSNDNPPQRVDDLIHSFNSDTIDKADIETSPRKREIETAVATANQPKIPTINKAGRDIYYPPGHDMMLTKREEMSASSAAGGRWAKGSGMYEYESGYKTKMKTKSGGAVVPVCLPLCCAMPCSIM